MNKISSLPNFSFVCTYLPAARESLLLELKSLCILPKHIEHSYLILETNPKAIIKFLLLTRLSIRVMWLIEKFEFLDADNLFKQFSTLDFPKFSHPDLSFKIQVTEIKNPRQSSLIPHEKYAALRLKDAICDYWQKHSLKRPSVDTDTPQSKIHLFVIGSHAFIAQELTLSPVGERSMRPKVNTVKAPLKEYLAATLLENTKYQPGKDVFFDPMCGSGTFIWEAILKSLNISPQYLKLVQNESLLAMNIPFFKQQPEWIHFYQEQIELILKHGQRQLETYPTGFFHGNDDNIENIVALRKWLKELIPMRATGNDLINFSHVNATQTLGPVEKGGFVITNPPWGERLEALSLDQWKIWGENFKKNYPRYRIHIYSNDSFIGKKLGLIPGNKLQFHHGNQQTHFYKFFIHS